MCDKTDEGKYDLEQKHIKNTKEIEDLQKRVVDIKCKSGHMSHIFKHFRPSSILLCE